jgi:hypothetical protein
MMQSDFSIAQSKTVRHLEALSAKIVEAYNRLPDPESLAFIERHCNMHLAFSYPVDSKTSASTLIDHADPEQQQPIAMRLPTEPSTTGTPPIQDLQILNTIAMKMAHPDFQVELLNTSVHLDDKDPRRAVVWTTTTLKGTEKQGCAQTAFDRESVCQMHFCRRRDGTWVFNKHAPMHGEGNRFVDGL